MASLPADASLPAAVETPASTAARAPSAPPPPSSLRSPPPPPVAASADRARRDVSELSDLSSIGDGEDAASRTGKDSTSSSAARVRLAGGGGGQKLSAGDAAQGASTNGDLPSELTDASLPPAAPSTSTTSTTAPAGSLFGAATPIAAPPAPRSLSSALSSPGSPAASNSSDPTAETEPLPGSPGADDLDEDDDDDDDGNGDEAARSEQDEDDLEPSSAVRSPSKADKTSSAKGTTTAGGGSSSRAPSAPPPPTKSLNGNLATSNLLARRAATVSPSKAADTAAAAAAAGGSADKPIDAKGLHALGIWKGEEEADSDLTPDEESDADDPGTTQGADEDEDDKMDVDEPATGGKQQQSTPRASRRTSTTGMQDEERSSAGEEEDDDDDAQPRRTSSRRRSSQASLLTRKVPPAEDGDDADSESADDDDAERTPNGTSKKPPAATASPSKAAPSARDKSPAVPQSEELSPPPTSPTNSDDEDADDDDAGSNDDDDDGKTPTKAKPDVRFSLIDANANAVPEDEDMDDDDENEDEPAGGAETSAPGTINGEVPEVRIEEAPDVVAGEEADAEAASTAEEVAVPDTPVLGGPESENPFPVALNLQAQQRLEAMEALSKIEIAFARLRDLMHIERMEECAREEEKLLNDTHPLLTQVQTRLTALRDRELSSIEARHAVATKESALVEKAEVSGIWEWWRNGREELQKDMMADVMRKRRRVDREKRAVEGGRPKRPLPVPPPYKRVVKPRNGPLLEELLPSNYLNYPPKEKKRMREEREAWGPRPGLMGLDERGRDNDLDMLGIGPSFRQYPHQPQMFRPFDGHGPPMMGGPPMHHHHHVFQGQPPQPYHPLHPHVYPPPPPPHPADGAYLQNRPPYPYRPPIIPGYQAEPHLAHGQQPPQQMPLHPHQHQQHQQHQHAPLPGGPTQPPPPPPPPPHQLGSLQPAFGETFGKPPASVVIPRPPPGATGHHATGRAIMPTSSLPPNGVVGPAGGPEVGHPPYATSTFDMTFGGGGSASGTVQEYVHPPQAQANGPAAGVSPAGAAGENGSPHKPPHAGSPVGFRTLGIV